MQMEEELGIKLFRRSKHSIVLTEEGMLLRRRAQEIVDLAEKTEKELLYQEENIVGAGICKRYRNQDLGKCIAEIVETMKEI